METYPLRLRKDLSARGFTMLEVMVAIFVMTVGLVALSALAAKTMSGTESSRFAGLAANLASEKLEDLNRWPYWDPNVYVAAGSTAGGLTSDVQASVTSGITETVNWITTSAFLTKPAPLFIPIRWPFSTATGWKEER